MKNYSDLSVSYGQRDQAVGRPEKLDPLTTTLDWQALAERRIQRIVEVESDHARMAKQLTALQHDYRKLLMAGESQSERIKAFECRCLMLENQLQHAIQQHDSMQSAFLTSRSWRITSPLRVLSKGYALIKKRFR